MIKAVLTDIEGTITDISFVKNVLFPYARECMADFIEEHQNDADVLEQIDAVRDELDDPEASLDAVIETLIHWIDTDKKIIPLKTLQGMIWEYGYQQGDFSGHIYRDAYDFLQALDEDIEIYIYSSGSVQAQILLFTYSDFEDISEWFGGFFDTNVGGKKESESYVEILNELELSGDEVLFFSDVEDELDAASDAGLFTCQLVRDDQHPSKHHPWIYDFTEFSWGLLDD